MKLLKEGRNFWTFAATTGKFFFFVFDSVNGLWMSGWMDAEMEGWMDAAMEMDKHKTKHESNTIEIRGCQCVTQLRRSKKRKHR